MLTASEITRYSRHLLLDDVGYAGQLRLKAASVVCVGAGGLGSAALQYLAAAGVGRIGIVDNDEVDLTNLQRQVIHSTGSVGHRKVESAQDRIHEINPHVIVDMHDLRLNAHNALDTLRSYDVVLDCTDNAAARYLVNDACVLLGKPNVYGGISKYLGQVSVFNLNGSPNYRDLYPTPPQTGVVHAGAEGGVLGVLPGVIGTLQAAETLKILLGLGSSLASRLLIFDVRSMMFREVGYSKLSTTQITTLTDLVRHHPQSPAQRLKPTEVVQRMLAGWAPFVLDVRSAPEVDIVQIPHNLREPDVAAVVDTLPRDRDILVYCKTGTRSARACAVLTEHGFNRLYDLEGGILAWVATVDSSLPTY